MTNGAPGGGNWSCYLRFQAPLDLLDDVGDRHDALPQLERDLVGEPLADALFGGYDGAVVAVAELLAHLTVGGAGVLAGQEHGEHARVAVDPLAFLGDEEVARDAEHVADHALDVRE